MLELNSLITLVICVVLILLWNYLRWKLSYFERHGVRTLPYYVPFIGHMWGHMLQKEHIKDMVDKLYKAFPCEKYIGVQLLTSSLIMIKDIDLIKQLTIKDFDHFQDRLSHIDQTIDPIFGGILVALKGQKWRDMRSTLSPAFTSSKMKGMFDFVEECAVQTVDHFNKEIKMAKDGIFNVEMKDLFNRYVNDVIASSAFGIKINSLEDVNNDFYTMGKKAIDFSGLKFLKFLFAASSPKLFNALGLSITNKSVNNFYRKLVKDNMDERVEKNIIRPDMLHLLMEAKKGSLKYEASNNEKDTGFSTVEESSHGKSTVKTKWSDDDITAQAVLFLLAGFDTTASLLSFIAHELTINSDIQKKLQCEIDDVVQNNDGKLTYASLHNMVYMDMIVSETLRKWPPFILVDRKCVKPYLLSTSHDASDKQYLVKVDEGIQIPIFSIHHDPVYYPDPEKFDPERFSEKNKDKIKPNSYLPFGIGPRNCIGSRFALMETKVVIFHLLKNYDLIPIDKTDNPLTIDKTVFSLTAKNGFWIGLKHRNK